MSDVFISYKAEEFNEANWVKTTLETNGISCWMAPMSIPGGSNYAIEIPQAIRTAKVFVLILSEQCQLSKWVPRELDQAINEGKTILPFMLENCPLKDDFNFYLSNVQRYAAYESKSAAIERMINEIRVLLSLSAAKSGDFQPKPLEQRVTKPTEPAPLKPSTDATGVVSTTSVVDEASKPVPSPVVPAAPEKTNISKAPKPPKMPKAKRPNTSGQTKKIRPWMWILSSIVLVIAVTVVAVLVIQANNTVWIAGEKFSKSDTMLTLKEKTLSAEDAENLSRIYHLSTLSLADCELSNVDLNDLFASVGYRLELNNCNISDQQLASVHFEQVSLQALVLDNNPSVTDLSVIQPLGQSISDLSFNHCSVSDLSFLSGFPELCKLSASHNALSSLSALSGCTKLTSLDVSHNNLSNLDGLEACISLQKINAGDNQIDNINGLANATLLSEVDFSNNRLTDISLLSKSVEKLSKVSLSDNQLTDLDALKGTKKLWILQISNNQIASLKPLSASTELTKLYAAHNKLTDISALSQCTKLVSLDLSDNSIEKTDAIRFDETAYGVSLNVSHNAIRALALPDVKYNDLVVYGNPLTEWSALYTTKGSQLVLDYNDGIHFDALSGSNYSDYYIFDCPLDQQISIEEVLGSYKVTFTTEQDFLQEQKNG